jgi:type II secretory pathway predicted ATPase ExeA/DNA-binding XRE family transcriptional regulator
LSILEDGKLSLLAEFGYRRDPFLAFTMETADTLRIKRLVSMAAESRASVFIVGKRGDGKTESIKLALQNVKNAIDVQLISSEKEMIKISDIERALIIHCSPDPEKPEPIKRTREIRARQVRRIVGEAAKNNNIVLRLEEAHRMHHSTLRSLKTMREMEYHGMCPLFTIVLVGQFDSLKQPGMDEVRLRTDTIKMRGLTEKEIAAYIAGTVGAHFEQEAVDALSRETKLADGREPSNFLTLQEILCDAMNEALKHGHKKVTALDVFTLCGGGIKELRIKAKMSLAEMSSESGVNKSTLHAVESGTAHSLKKETVAAAKSAVAGVLEKHLHVKLEQEAEAKAV